MHENAKIGIFDSGIGGVTVLKEIIKILPNEDYIYYSDSKNNPYGDKTDEKIKTYLEKNIGIYRGKVKNVILGCTHYPLIKDEIKKVLGDVQFFNGAERLAENLKNTLVKNGNTNQENGEIEFIDSQMSETKRERFYKILKN